MSKTWIGIVGSVLAVLLIVWLLGGTKISCRESFWNKDKHVIEIQH